MVKKTEHTPGSTDTWGPRWPCLRFRSTRWRHGRQRVGTSLAWPQLAPGFSQTREPAPLSRHSRSSCLRNEPVGAGITQHTFRLTKACRRPCGSNDTAQGATIQQGATPHSGVQAPHCTHAGEHEPARAAISSSSSTMRPLDSLSSFSTLSSMSCKHNEHTRGPPQATYRAEAAHLYRSLVRGESVCGRFVPNALYPSPQASNRFNTREQGHQKTHGGWGGG
jgi:hypothetical protein